jgi:DNA-binding MarR family transcriptional regulator
MKPTRDDVFEMVAGLMAVFAGIERARRLGDASHLATLQMVATHQRMRPSDIAAELGVHQSTITRQIQSLEKSGYVSVAGDSKDRRSCFVTLTDAGASEARRLTEIGLSRFAKFVENWEAEDVQTLSRLLWKLEQSKAEIGKEEHKLPGRSWQSGK